jgi:hypothetical protein
MAINNWETFNKGDIPQSQIMAITQTILVTISVTILRTISLTIITIQPKTIHNQIIFTTKTQ